MTLGTFYDEYPKAVSERNLPSTQVATDDPTGPFKLWTSHHDG